MRRKIWLLLPLLLAGAVGAQAYTTIRGTRPYSATDLQQVRQAYVELLPTYLGFKRFYSAGQRTGILTYYHRERSQCRLVDQIDKRDTIDPNVNLFQASIGLDDMCNAVESAYASWAIEHHHPYPKQVVPARPFEAFIISDKSVHTMTKFLKHPAALG